MPNVKPLRRALCAGGLCLLLWAVPSGSGAAPKLDIGADYRIRAIQLNNPNYGTDGPIGANQTVVQKYVSQRGRVYLTGKFDPGIEIGTVIQAIGVTGSSGPVIGHASTGTVVGRYPSENFLPFLENFYVRVNEFRDWPVSLTLGRQPYVWGNGLLVSDDGMGFDGIRLDAGPFWGLRTHLFTAKPSDKIAGENNAELHLAGLSYQWGIHNVSLGWIQEARPGASYFNVTFSTPVSARQVSRQFYSLNLNARLEQGAFYNAEYAMQAGKAQMPEGTDIKLGGSALTFEGGFDFLHPRYKRMILAFMFMQGSGDEHSSRDEDERFLPSFGRKYDGLERAGLGEFFAATPYSFFNEERVIVVDPQIAGRSFPYRRLFSGIRVFGFRGSVNPWEPFVAGLEFYLYSARTKPDIREGAPTTMVEGALGRELVISGKYSYAKRVNFIVRWGKFFPGDLLNTVGSSRLILEAQARF